MTTTEIKIVSSCTEITLDRFIDVMVDGRLDLLIISGEPTKEELEKAWGIIYAEYTELIGDDSYTDVIKLMKDINILSQQYYRIHILIEVLINCYIPAAHQELKRMGYTVRYSPDDLVTYLHDLESAYNKSQMLLTRISVMEQDLLNKSKKTDNKEFGRGDFQTMLISLSEHVKYQVIPSQVTAYQFAVMIHRAREYSDKLSRKLRKQKGGSYG